MLGASVIWLAGVVREPPLPTDRTEKAATVVAVIFVHPLRVALRLHASPSLGEGESVHFDGVDVGGPTWA